MNLGHCPLLLILVCLLPGLSAGQGVMENEQARSKAPLAPAGGGIFDGATSDELSPALMDRIGNKIVDNRAELVRRGLLPVSRRASEPRFAFPMAASGAGSEGFHATTNFVDHNQAVSNLLEDYNCGTRTYDTADGYNHRGVDLVTWPFPWLAMDSDQVQVVAAAPGTILSKLDGNFDRNCATNENDPNYVTIEHSDGSIALYLHLKNGSLTSKGIGESVNEGEYLGIVGSSGSSTAPHLHFEVWDGSEPQQLIDPFAGLCNQLNAASWWQQQPEYYDSRINRLATHSAAPEIPSCPTQETPHFESFFERDGDSVTVYTAAYYRDQRSSQSTDYSVLRPDGSLYSSWNHSAVAAHSAMSYWYWFWTIPLNAPEGRWTFRADYQGQVTDQYFYIDPLFASSFENGDLTSWD